MECPCDTCQKEKECPSAYVCPEMKLWLIERKRKKPVEKDVFITNEDNKDNE